MGAGPPRHRGRPPVDARGRAVPDRSRKEGTISTGLSRRTFCATSAPARDTDSSSAPWVFCYACDLTELDGFEVLSEGRDGIRFGRMRP